MESHYRGTLPAPAQAVSLASDDFDVDGINDLAIGLATSTTGMIAIHRGNLDAFAPQSEASFLAISRGEFPPPFLPEAQLVSIPSRPDFLATGNFIGLQGPGVVAAGRNQRKLHVVARGESGSMQLQQTIDLPGPITALAAHQLVNGKYIQVVVGVRAAHGPELRIYSGGQEGLSEIANFRLENAADAFAFGNLDGDGIEDVLVLAGGKVSILHGGSQAIDSIEVPYAVSAVVSGQFVFDRDRLSQIALLASDGSLHILTHDGLDQRPLTLEEGRALRLQSVQPSRGPSRPPPAQLPVMWKEFESFSQVAGPDAVNGGPSMFRTRISSNGADDIMLLGASRLSVVAHADQNPATGIVMDRADLGADAIAALPARVNIDGRPGVVFLKRGDIMPHVMMPLPDPVFFPNRFDDPAVPLTGGAPNTAAFCNNTGNSDTSSPCSLREAIIKANLTAGTDTIMLAAGTYTLALPRNASDHHTSLQGTLEVQDSVNIVGAGQSTTIIQGGTNLTTSVDKVISFNQDIDSFTNATVSVSNLTIQNGNNRGDCCATQDGFGGGFDFDTGQFGTANLTMTNVTVQNNRVNNGQGGGFVIFNTKFGSGFATFVNMIIQGNVSSPNAVGCCGDGGGLVIDARSKMVMTNSQVTNNQTLSNAGTNATGGGMFLSGEHTQPQSRISGSLISGNTAAGLGGGMNTGATLLIDTGTVISSNSAGSDANGFGGGGIQNDASDGLTLNHITISGNSTTGHGGALSTGNGQGNASVSVQFSRLAGNTAATGGSNIFNFTGTTTGNQITATNNWWGTNSPATTISSSSTTCPALAPANSVCFTPFIKLVFPPSSTSMNVGGTSTLTGSFLQDSNNTPIAASNLAVLAGVPIAFNSPAHGTLSNAQSAIQNLQNVASASESGTTITIATTASHGFSIGQGVRVIGVGAGYDGLYTIATTPTPTSFTYAADTSLVALPSMGAGGTASVPGGTATVTFTGTTVGPGTANAVIDGFTLTSSPVIAVNSPTTTAGVNQTATYNDANQNVTLSATVTAACCTVAGGTVTFTLFNGATQIGSPAVSGAVSGGTASATYVLPGGTNAATYSIHASYSGTATGTGDFLTSSDNTRTLTVNQAPTTTAAANVTANFSASSQTVPLSATVTSVDGIVNAGTVTFTLFDASNVQVGSPVTSGTVAAGSAAANFTLPANTQIGGYSIHATYSGSTNFSTSSDNAHSLIVNAPTTTTASAASATFNTANQNVTLTATVVSAGGTVNAGTVTFSVFNGATQIGSSAVGTVSAGSASATYVLPGGSSAGTYSIHASFGGSGFFLASSDSTHSLVVAPASTTTTAANASKTFSQSSQIVLLSATVSSSTAVNEGTVTFTVKNGGLTVGVPVSSSTVSGGAASANFSLPGGTAAGMYTIQAVYNAGADFTGSSDATHTLTVGQATPTITWSNPADIVFGSALSTVQLNATAGITGTFAYTPAAGAVLPVGNGQTLSVQFTPTDTTDYTTASKNVLINVTSAPGAATLVMTDTLVRDGGTNEVVVTVTLANTGGSPATSVQVASAAIGATSTTTALPVAMTDVPAGGSSSIQLRFPGSVGSAGTRTVLSVKGTYAGGSFGGSARITLP